MIEFESFIYLDVYRTGSTHVIRLLKQIADERLVQEYRHAPLTKGRPLFWATGKLVFATVRNPWDWYVSLWSYGADGKSAIRRYLAKALTAEEVRALYDGSEPALAFRRWLYRLHDPAFADRVMEEHYPESKLSGVMGLYTYRFMRVTTPFPSLVLKRWRVRSLPGAIAYHRRWKTYNVLLRNETLDDDLIAFVRDQRDRCRFKTDAETTIRNAARHPLNFSNRALPSYRDYYDPESRELVARRDRFFVETFGYEF